MSEATVVSEKDYDQETGEPVDDALEPQILIQFIFHPENGEISLEVAKNIDLTDLVKCRRMLSEQIEDAQVNLSLALHNGQQAMLNKQQGALEGIREILKDILIRKSKDSSLTKVKK